MGLRGGKRFGEMNAWDHNVPAFGVTFKWTNTSVAGKRTVRSGTVMAGKWGLVTLKNVKVTNRLLIEK